MKYICLGYIEPGKFEGMTESEQPAMFDKCFAYNDHLRANGHLVAEVALQPPETALTLYWKNGKVATTDGPYAETKEQLPDGRVVSRTFFQNQDLRRFYARGKGLGCQGNPTWSGADDD